jgi:hypothetical protein
MSTTVHTPNWLHGLLPHLGADEEFAAVRQVIQTCGFDERGVTDRLEIEDIAHFKSIRQGRRSALDMQSPIDVSSACFSMAK